MTNEAGRSPELRRLESAVDAELDRAESSVDPSAPADPEVVEYETRLRSLHDAVTVLETHENRDDAD